MTFPNLVILKVLFHPLSVNDILGYTYMFTRQLDLACVKTADLLTIAQFSGMMYLPKKG